MEIEIYSDVVCPWCWIGTRKLLAALEEFDGEVSLKWRAYQLDPSATSEGVPTAEYIGKRFGGRDQAMRMFQQVSGVAAQVGLDMRFDRAISANTIDAHKLIWLAGEHGVQHELVESLYAAHFTDGLDLGSAEVLVSRAVAVGLPEGLVREALLSPEAAAAVSSDLASARELGITGVPTFIFEGKYSVTGAQDPATLLQVLQEVRKREAKQPISLVTAGGGEVCTDETC
ncbi:putative DsbA family dithiol-disulfide isomerase [Allocatelliglobosispora scoriae]|uniref:Putative DsbA family dithiol-disulfide isomerase n=1 Tax=Allocatelliglobosispora scoriae TaxID=643052 RepID=A0A841BW90_9ACTN|nr:DsbA family oxidoreductase [Allocatelliglobosispora scoriae]MBB5871032.1 putative DsbA family dithiol-disulfide isomerase [Allocatelliglobosispora scoriae]